MADLPTAEIYAHFLLFQNERIDLHSYTNVNCSHMVYGFAWINGEYDLQLATNYDLIYGETYGNFKKITEWVILLVKFPRNTVILKFLLFKIKLMFCPFLMFFQECSIFPIGS